MSVTITIEPTLEMWQAFYSAHYAADHQLKIRFWYGFACLALGAFGLGGLFAAKLPALFLLAFGLYCVLSRQILLLRSLRKIRANPQALRPVTYRCDANGLEASGAAGTTTKLWSDFSGYRLAPPGLLLYRPDGSFLFLPRSGCDEEQWREVVRLLERGQVAGR